MNPVFEEKSKRILKGFTGQNPDRVPVIPIIETWAEHQAGISVVDAYTKDPKLLYESIKYVNDRVYMDGYLCVMTGFPVNVVRHFGEGLYRVSEEGLQVIGGKGETMHEDEYPQLIEDPMKFIADVVVPRKYPSVNEDRDKLVTTWFKSIMDFLAWDKHNKKATRMVEKNANLPIYMGAVSFLPPDVMLDYFRDFRGICTDIRRQPENVLKAMDALYPIYLSLVKTMYKKPNKKDAKIVWTPLHLPTYLKPKDFEKFYFPYMSRYISDLCGEGYNVFFYMEGDWGRHLDYLRDLPDGNVTGLFEKGDYVKIKNAVCGKMVFAGGINYKTLAHGTVQDNIDQAKWCLDNLAPGGRYMFSNGEDLLSKNDAKMENLAAACAYIHDNGKF